MLTFGLIAGGLLAAFILFAVGSHIGERWRTAEYESMRPTVFHDEQAGEWVCNIPWIDYSYFGGLRCNHEGRGTTPQKAYIRAIKNSHRYKQIPKEVLKVAKTAASTKI
jgi:uncharacterized C2H2 Zn-finger protein